MADLAKIPGWLAALAMDAEWTREQIQENWEDQLRTVRAEALSDVAGRLLSLAREFRNDGHYNQAYRVEALADDLVKAEGD